MALTAAIPLFATRTFDITRLPPWLKINSDRAWLLLLFICCRLIWKKKRGHVVAIDDWAQLKIATATSFENTKMSEQHQYPATPSSIAPPDSAYSRKSTAMEGAKLEGDGDSIRVVVRVRPLNTLEKQRNDNKVVTCADDFQTLKVLQLI